MDLLGRGYGKGKEALHTRPRVAYHAPMWTEANAVGTMEFAKLTRAEPGIRAKGKRIDQAQGAFELRKPTAAYAGNFGAQKEDISLQNTFLLPDYPKVATR